METFTTTYILLNSTDLNKILCNLGVRNVSECESEMEKQPMHKDINERVRILLYSIIFLLSVVGNGLIILVLGKDMKKNKKSNITNMFLLSLAVSDLLVSLVCIPFTLIPNLMKDFIFGLGMCKMITYFMAVSVSVSTFTLMAISLERYKAICNPLESKSWQTTSHARKVIIVTWVVSFFLMLPYPIFSNLKSFTRLNNSTGHMCRLIWPNDIIQQSWYVSLLLILFLIPGLLMMTAYGLISLELYKGIKAELQSKRTSERLNSAGSLKSGEKDGCSLKLFKKNSLASTRGSSSKAPPVEFRKTSNDLQSKKRVISMLLVIVFLFFLCWTPIFVVNAWQAFDPNSKYRLSGAPISFIHLLSYISACVNPIVYCFMNKKFRQSLLNIFPCLKRCCGMCKRREGTYGPETPKSSKNRNYHKGKRSSLPSEITRYTFTGSDGFTSDELA